MSIKNHYRGIASMKRIGLILLLCLTTAGCATDYHRIGLGGGFEETQLSENIWNVTFVGNGYTSSLRAADLAILRSADLAYMNGYKFFILTSSFDSINYSTYTTPVTATTNYQGNTAYTNIQGGHTYIISKPSQSNTVVMFKEKPRGITNVYDADFVCKSIGKKYDIQCGVIP